MTKEMMVDIGLDPDPVLSNYLMMHCCNGSHVHEISTEYHVELLRDMLKYAGHDLDECLDDWRANHRAKRIMPNKERMNAKQLKIFQRINSYDDKACGIGLKIYR